MPHSQDYQNDHYYWIKMIKKMLISQDYQNGHYYWTKMIKKRNLGRILIAHANDSFLWTKIKKSDSPNSTTKKKNSIFTRETPNSGNYIKWREEKFLCKATYTDWGLQAMRDSSSLNYWDANASTATARMMAQSSSLKITAFLRGRIRGETCAERGDGLRLANFVTSPSHVFLPTIALREFSIFPVLEHIVKSKSPFLSEE